MYMFNNGPPPPCPWGGYNPANRQMYMNGPQPFPPGPPHPAMPNNMMPQHMRHWQGPGPSRMRGRGYRRGRGSSSHLGNNRNQGQVEELAKEKAERLIKQEKELKDKQRRLSKDQESFKREMKKEREEVCRQWQQLRDEIVRMEEMHNIQKGRIKLDVGGHVFTTSKLTLTREADSMLAAMFSGRHELVKEEDGCVFIDRDGTHFRYVLNYLRDGGVAMDCLPRDRQILKELKKEATFYQLHGLMQQIEKYLY
ncbi:BACD3-like protein [Mya arenaria]|uniref:BACD3-like protein n=1 Tax=Mya arenaria TaxID=6604 RepID=A0ABY7EHX8_MYAAR|nr:BACD3-like protein [Mya arenaria]